MNQQDLQNLIEYSYWARDRVLDAVAVLTPEQYTRDLGNSFKSIRDTLVHSYSAEWVWYSRWHGTSPTEPLKFADYPDVPSLQTAWRELEAKMRALVAGIDEPAITRVHEFRFMNGEPAQGVFWQTFQHVVNHGTYHRGQVTTMLRQLGAAPPKSTDMVFFYRERAS